MRTPIIAGNWKMNKTVSEAGELVADLKQAVAGVQGVEVVVCPPFTALAQAVAQAQGSEIKVGAQNMYWEEKGAFTGEVSPAMLKEVGCTYVILGHSERRQFFGETDETVNRKVKTAFNFGLLPIVCVGELLQEREAGNTDKVVTSQISGSLADLSVEQVSQLVVAYEPVWAIGTGKTASNEDAQQVIGLIRRHIAGMYGQQAAEAVRIQYGGSVNADTIKGLMAQPDIDGALVGGASLSAQAFAPIVKFNS
ncbi:MAG TPA: triose-phosphate isomerase [Bacillota bacterium]|nr:triose-phosphate isomerase [Bacillota bacterium]